MECIKYITQTLTQDTQYPHGQFLFMVVLERFQRKCGAGMFNCSVCSLHAAWQATEYLAISL